MLSKPEGGWSDFELGDFQTSVSYIEDVPFNWLRACLNGLKYNLPISFFIEEEGSNCILTSYDNTYIIVEEDEDYGNEEAEIKTIRGIDSLDISYLLLLDIKEYFDDWVTWYCMNRKNRILNGEKQSFVN